MVQTNQRQLVLLQPTLTYTIDAVPASIKAQSLLRISDITGTASLSENLKGGGSAYELDATSITQVTSGGDPTNPNTVAGLSITEVGACNV